MILPRPQVVGMAFASFFSCLVDGFPGVPVVRDDASGEWMSQYSSWQTSYLIGLRLFRVARAAHGRTHRPRGVYRDCDTNR